MLPTTPNAYIKVSIDAAKTACKTNKYGAMNKNVNSNGSVIPTTTAVNVAGISSAATFYDFLLGVVAYIAKAIPKHPNTFHFLEA